MTTYKQVQHVYRLLAAMQSMLDHRHFCDVSLFCQDGTVLTSGLLLASISPLFKILGRQGMDEFTVILPDFKIHEIQLFLHQLTSPLALKREDDRSFDAILNFFQQQFVEVMNDDIDDDNGEDEDEEFQIKSEDEIMDSEDNFSFSDDDSEEFDEEKPVKKAVKSRQKTRNKLATQAKETYDEDLKMYVCPHCSLQLKAGMTNHLKWHLEHPGEAYPSRSTCEHCGKTFKKIGILRAHIFRMHSNMPKKFKCTYEGCDRAFKMRGELNTHYLIHSNAKNFICTECGLGFRTKMAMDSHTLRKHTNIKPSIPCEECGKLFKVKSDLYSHAMTHKARKERIHRCNDCNLTFRTEKSLSRHLELHDPSRPLACHKCPLRYKNKDQLVRHVQTHEKPNIECELCHRVFGRPDHLKRHIATKHASLSVVEQMYLSENLNKKKQKSKDTAGHPQVLAHFSHPPVSQSDMTLPASILQKLEPLPMESAVVSTAAATGNGSELATLSVTDISSNMLQNLITTPSSAVAGGLHYRSNSQPLDFTPMQFQISLPTQTSQQPPNNQQQ